LLIKQETAIQFGQSLDQDEFDRTAQLIHPNCKYAIGEKILVGPKAICQSYEDNMKEGRAKLDLLEWGKSRIEVINEDQFFVHFTDYLGHKGKKYTHRCKQKLSINEENLIVEIEHIANQKEEEGLSDFYKSVGLK